MKANRGERYTCTDPDCGCEVEIIKPCSAQMEEVDENSMPSCFCGADMQPAERGSAAQA